MFHGHRRWTCDESNLLDVAVHAIIGGPSAMEYTLLDSKVRGTGAGRQQAMWVSTAFCGSPTKPSDKKKSRVRRWQLREASRLCGRKRCC